jgi:hypothetical protein
MSNPNPTNDPSEVPGTWQYRNRLRDQDQQYNTEDIGASEEWQAGENEVSSMTAGTAQTPTNFPTGEDTELNVNDE